MARKGPGESRIQGILRSYVPIKGAFFFFFFPYTGGKLYVYVFKRVLHSFFSYCNGCGWGEEVDQFGRSNTEIGLPWLAQMVKNWPAMQVSRFQSLGQEDLLEEGIATHSSILA